MFPEAKLSETLRAREKKTHCFLRGPVIKCFVVPLNSKLEKTAKKSFASCWLTHKFVTVSRGTT